MPSGLLIQSTTGQVQIDEAYRNLVLREKRVVTLTDSPSDGSISGKRAEVLFTSTLPNPVIATKEASGTPICLVRRYYNTSNNRWYFRLWAPHAGPLDVTVYFFDVCPAPTGGGGLWVKNSAGETVYSSEYAPLNIVSSDIGSYTTGGTGGDSTFTISLPSGREYAAIHGLCGRRLVYWTTTVVGVTTYFAEFYMGCLATNSNSITHSLERFKYHDRSSPIPKADRTFKSYAILGIDVTGL